MRAFTRRVFSCRVPDVSTPLEYESTEWSAHGGDIARHLSLRKDVQSARQREEWSAHDGRAFASDCIAGSPRAPEERQMMDALSHLRLMVRSPQTNPKEIKRSRAASMIRNWWLSEGRRSRRASRDEDVANSSRHLRGSKLGSDNLDTTQISRLPSFLPGTVVNALRGQKMCVLRAWLDLGGCPNSIDGSSSTALHYAVLAPFMDAIKLLLQSGCTPDVQLSGGGATPLLIATIKAHHAAVITLLAAGADSNISDSEGHTPLMVASRAGDIRLVKLRTHTATMPPPRRAPLLLPTD